MSVYKCIFNLCFITVFSIIQVDGRSGWKMNNLDDPEKQEEKAQTPDDWNCTPHLFIPRSATTVLNKCKNYWERDL